MNKVLILFLFLYSISADGQDSNVVKFGEKKQLHVAAKSNINRNTIDVDTTKLKIKKNLSSIDHKEESKQKFIVSDNLNTSNRINGKIDTIDLTLNIGEELSIPVDSNSPAKIIMIQEKSKSDFFKYLLPILTLLLGILIKEFLDKSNNKKKIKKTGERWIAELRSLEEPLIKQIEVFEVFLLEHKVEEFSIPPVSLYSSLNGEVFKSLDKNELIHYIESKNKKSDFEDIIRISNRTHGYLSILVNLHSTLKDKFDKYLTQTSNYIEAFNKNLQSFNIAFAEYGVLIEKEINSDPKNDMRYKPVVDLYSTFIMPHMDDGKFNPFVLQTEFFIPIIFNLSKYRLEPITKPLLTISNDSLNNIKGISMERHYMNEIIIKMIDSYRELLKDLKDIVNNIENH